MARIPQDFIDNLLERTDIVSLIDARVSLKKTGREYEARCPFHDEKTPSFTVSPSKQFYHCFGCGAHGSAISFLMEYDRLEFRDAIETLAQAAGMVVPEEQGGPNDKPQKLAPLLDAMAAADRFWQGALRQSPEAIAYLKQRGVSGRTAKQFGIGYAPPGWHNLQQRLQNEQAAATAGLLITRDDGGRHDRFRNRIMFPIRDTRGRTIACGGRALGDDKAKYLNSPETPLFHKSRQMYGLFEARQAMHQLPRLLVVEGYMDVIALAQNGFPNTVATLGTATTPEHLTLLFRHTEEVVFCFDGDAAGRRAADKAMLQCLPVMRGSRRVRFLFLPDGEDPDSMVRNNDGRAQLQAAIESARPLSAMLMTHITAGSTPRTPEERTAARERARPLVKALPPDTFREEIAKELSHILGDPPEHLLADLTRQNSPPPAATHAGQPDRHTTTDNKHAIRITAASTALRLLLHNPALANQIDKPDTLRSAGAQGAGILADAVEFFRDRPDIPLAHWLERYRDQPVFERLHKLAAMAPPGDDADDHRRAFVDSVNKLQHIGQRAVLKQRYDELLASQSQRRLDNHEAQELRHILAALQASPDN